MIAKVSQLRRWIMELSADIAVMLVSYFVMSIVALREMWQR